MAFATCGKPTAGSFGMGERAAGNTAEVNDMRERYSNFDILLMAISGVVASLAVHIVVTLFRH